MRIQAEPSEILLTVNGVPCRVWNAVTESGEQIFLFVWKVAVPRDSRDGLIFDQELIELIERPAEPGSG